MERETPCPSQVELEALVREALPEERAEILLPHLGECEKCQAALESISGTRNFRLDEDTVTSEDIHDPPTREFVDRMKHETRALEDTAPANRGELGFLTFSHKAGSLGKLGDYDVLELIGKGGMGLVLRAHDPDLDREIAIKVLTPSLAADQTARERFVREARTAAGLDHENVLPIYTVDRSGQLPFFTMPLVEGTCLQELLDKREKPLPVEQILRIAGKLAQGLAAAHSQDLIHRDIKPANILLDDNAERVWLADFGLARALESPSVTLAGTLVGTPQFMAPEQLDDQSPDKRSDLFSLGAVLYNLATGTPPFAAKSTASTIRKVIDAQPQTPLKVNPELPQWFSALIEQLLRKNPDQRPASAQEVAAILDRHDQQTVGPSSTISWRLLAAGSLTVLAGILAFVWLTKDPKPFRLASNGKGFFTLREAIEAAEDGDTIRLVQSYTSVESLLDLGDKALTLLPKNSETRTVLDFTPPVELNSGEDLYTLPRLQSNGDLVLKNLTIVRKHIGQGHRDDVGYAPMIHARGSRVIFERCRFELQQPNFVGIPLAEVLIGNVDQCEIKECVFLHMNRGISLLFRNDTKGADGSAQISLHDNVVIGSTTFFALQHQEPRVVELSVKDNVMATKHPYIFRPSHVWADVIANPVEGNLYSITVEQRMSVIRVGGGLEPIRDHLHWTGRENTVLTLPPRPTRDLERLVIVRVTGDLAPGTRRPVILSRTWDGWSPNISERDFKMVALESPFTLPEDQSLDQLDVNALVRAIEEPLLETAAP